MHKEKKKTPCIKKIQINKIHEVAITPMKLARAASYSMRRELYRAFCFCKVRIDSMHPLSTGRARDYKPFKHLNTIRYVCRSENYE